MLLVSDSCEAFTLFDYVESPNIFAIGSSIVGDKSFSHGNDENIKVAKTDKFTFVTNEFLKHEFALNNSLTV